ncbi:MAG: restriction endonuclease subunit S [Sulfurovum sp.]|nr:restriction endonuclease subunit S [Sulfurovum sp.]
MNKLVPKLRFDGFSGEWEESTLGKVLKFLDGQRKPIKESDRAKMQGEYPYYGASGIIDYVNDYIFDEDLILLGEDGENIVSRNSPLVFKISGKSWINNHAHVLKPKKPHNLDFLVQYMEDQSYLKYNSGGAQPKLNQAVCKTIPLTLPKPEEQQKIANCLSSLDNLIDSQNKKVEALKKHKKGLMQQLFPKDADKVPKLRFDGFSGEWDKKQINEILTIGSGRDYKKLSDGNIPVYGTGGYMLSVNNYLYDGESVCIGRKGTIDKPVFLKGKFWTVDTLFYTHSFKENIPKFIYSLFQKINWYKYNEASGVPSLSKVTIGK